MAGGGATGSSHRCPAPARSLPSPRPFWTSFKVGRWTLGPRRLNRNLTPPSWTGYTDGRNRSSLLFIVSCANPVQGACDGNRGGADLEAGNSRGGSLTDVSSVSIGAARIGLLGELGRCRAAAEARVFRHRVEVGEELELIPSHLFYLSGCDLRCKFCIAGAHAFNPQLGTELTADFFHRAVRWGRQQGAVNVQWVGGEPTIHLPAILR